jgi:hypothetical protein
MDNQSLSSLHHRMEQRHLFSLRYGLLALPSLILACMLSLVISPHQVTRVLSLSHLNIFLPLIQKAMPSDWLDRLLISEVCFDPFNGEPDGEWIEVYNAGINGIDLKNYKIGDAAVFGDKEGMLLFPPGASIKAGQVVIIANRAAVFYESYNRYPDYEMIDTLASVPDMDRYTAWAIRYVELTNSGDEVLILSPDNRVVDAVSWGTSTYAFKPSVVRPNEGGSIERFPAHYDTDTAQDWRAVTRPDPGQVDNRIPTPTPTRTYTTQPSHTPFQTSIPSSIPLNSPTTSPTAAASLTISLSSTPLPSMTPSITPIPTIFSQVLLISEVLYDPTGPEPNGEWIELFNPSPVRISLAGFKVGDEEEWGGNEGMLIFPAAAYIDPGQVILIANQAAAFYAAYQFQPDYEMNESDPGVPNMEKYTAWSSGNINLANTSPHDEVLILDGADKLVDALSWGASKWAFNPSALTAREGQSLERFPPAVDTDSAADWRVQDNPNPGVVIFPTPTSTPTFTSTPSLTPSNTPDPLFTPSLTEETPQPIITPTSPTATLVPVLVINEIHAKPSRTGGDANGDGVVHVEEDEFIEIANLTGAALDLSGWKIRDELGLRHTFPTGSVLQPGCAAVVFGGGTPQGQFGGSLVQTASSTSLRLDDGGDSIFIRNPEGSLTFSYTYHEEGGQDQSITRFPDLVGLEPLILHSTAPGSSGALFSPGTGIGGEPFTGCEPEVSSRSGPGVLFAKTFGLWVALLLLMQPLRSIHRLAA